MHPLAERRLNDGEAVVAPRLLEEQEAKAALARLNDLGVHDPAFNEELAALRDAVADHAEAEEALEFVRLREVVDADELRRMRAMARADAIAAATGANA
jgi:hypothetical protein